MQLVGLTRRRADYALLKKVCPLIENAHEVVANKRKRELANIHHGKKGKNFSEVIVSKLNLKKLLEEYKRRSREFILLVGCNPAKKISIKFIRIVPDWIGHVWDHTTILKELRRIILE